MSNVHGLNDLRDNENAQNNEDMRARFSNDFRSEIRNARNETFGQFLKGIFCRGLKFISFTSIMGIFLAIIYIITLCYGIESSTVYFLQPNQKGSLFVALRKDPFKIKDGEFWRFITYSFLHMDLVHITYNCIALLIFGSLIEQIMKPAKLAILWFVSGILGILFSSLIKTTISVGASVCVYGIIGAYVS